jgi:hypothetical protein
MKFVSDIKERKCPQMKKKLNYNCTLTRFAEQIIIEPYQAMAMMKYAEHKQNAIIKNLSRLLGICKVAIHDAICCEDGLDGATGQDIIKEIKKINLDKLTTCQECDHLIKENLKLGKKLNKNRDTIFIDHVKSHLKDNEFVICKICGKSADEIIKENKKCKT